MHASLNSMHVADFNTYALFLLHRQTKIAHFV